MRLHLYVKSYILVIFLFNIVNSYAKPPSTDSELLKRIIVAMDSLHSPTFDSLYGELHKEVYAINDDQTWNELIKLKVYKHYLLGNTDSLIYYTELSKHYSCRTDNENNFYHCWSYLINHYSLTGKVYKAITEANLMLTKASSDQSMLGMGLSRELLGEIYLYMDLYEESLAQLKKSYECFSQFNSLHNSLSSLSFSMNLVHIYSHDYEKVFEVCDKLDSLNIIDDDSKNVRHKKAFNLISMCCRSIASSRLQRFEESEIYFRKAKELFEETKMQHDFYRETEAIYHSERGNYKKALEDYDSLNNFYREIGLKKESLRIQKEIAHINSKMGNYKMAYQNYSSYEEAKDSIAVDMAYQHLNQLAVSNDLRNIELEKKNLQIEYEKAKSRNIIILMIGTLIVALIIFLYYVREIKLNRKLLISESSLKEEKKALARSENILIEALDKAKQAEILKTAFLANISHEIRTPLNSIIGFSEMIVSDDIENKQEFIDIIRDNNNILLKLIDDIIDVSQIEAENTIRNISNFNLSLLREELSKNDQNKTKPGVSWVFDKKYEDIIVNLDRSRLTQVIVNFISNAIKFTKKGFINIGFDIIEEGICIYVKDTGIGIKEEDISKIFDKFYKVNDFTQGTGLGMTLSKAIIDDCGGRIGIESVFGEGSKFYVIVPCEIGMHSLMTEKLLKD